MTYFERKPPRRSNLASGIPRILLYPLFFALILGLLYSVFETRQGVHTVFTLLDITDEDYPKGFEPDDPPVKVSRSVEMVRSIELPAGILQPSGITWSADGFDLFIATDQAELFALDGLTFEAVSDVTIKDAPLLLRQGQIETVAYHSGHLLLAGGYDTIGVWYDTPSAWSKTGTISLTQRGMDVAGDVTAIAVHPLTGTIYLADESTTLHVLDKFGAFERKLSIVADEVPGRALSEMKLVGITFTQGVLLAVTEYFNTVLMIDPHTGFVMDAIRLEGITKPSGIAFKDGEIFVTIDHEYNEASPGLKVFDLSDLNTLAVNG